MISFFIFLIIYLVTFSKVSEWYRISRLGFKSSTPLLYLKNPSIYDLIRWTIFSAALVIAIFEKSLYWYVYLPVLFFTQQAGVWLGRKRAYNTYRQICRRLMENAESQEERDELQIVSYRTDSDLDKYLSDIIKWKL